MTDQHGRRVVFWTAATSAVAAALAGYYAFEASLPDCGPPRNTLLGRIYWLVPLALLTAQSVAVILVGRRTGRSAILTGAVVALTTVIALIGGVAIWLHFFAAGDCGE